MYKSTATLGDVYHLALPLETQLLVGSELLNRPVSWACSLRPSPPAFPKLDGNELALVDMEDLRRLDPQMRALKALHSLASPGEQVTPEELEKQRRNQEILGRLMAPAAGMDWDEFFLSGMEAAWTRLKSPHGKRHAILYCHGGGYTSGNLGYSRVLAAKMTRATGYDTLSFEYRLAPEFPYPAAIEDGLRAWDHLMLQGYGAATSWVASKKSKVVVAEWWY